ncbi:MAG: hypothetical protein HC876_10170 [Chloroflexaceae bacterium]|nr:hypothetical protein [Chloroflexaceae bacterium]
MSDAQDPTPAMPLGSSQPAPATPQTGPLPPPNGTGGGCLQRLGQFFARLLFAVFVVLLAVAAVGGAAAFLGYTPYTPQDVQRTQQELVNLRAENQLLQTQVADLTIRQSNNNERADTLGQRVDTLTGDVETLHSQVGDIENLSIQMRENVALASTAQADLREGLVTIATFATVQAERGTQIEQLERSTERIIRFLQRLGDIANDTTIDLEATDPPDAALPPIEPATPQEPVLATDTPEPPGTAEPTATERPSPTLTDTVQPTETETSQATEEAQIATPTLTGNPDVPTEGPTTGADVSAQGIIE